MSLWKMGVAAPIYNNSFKYGTKVYALLDAPEGFTPSGATGPIYNVGRTSFDYQDDFGTDEGQSDGLIKYVKAGDRIRVGPSSRPEYAGAYEEFLVLSITSDNISLGSTSNIEFANDPIIALGTNCPGGWVPDDTNITMGGMVNHVLRTLTDYPGSGDRYSMQFENSSGTHGLFYTLDPEEYISGVYYRMGCYYQFTYQNTASMTARAETSVGVIINHTMLTNAATTWTEYNSNPVLTNHSNPTSFKAGFNIVATLGSGTANIDNVYLEHAKYTTDETSGVYTFDDYPALGSRAFRRIEQSKNARLLNRRMVRAGVGGDTAVRYIISASFKDVDNSLLENLEIFTDWQDRGMLSVLHHDIPSVPPNLQGILTIKNTNVAHWSSGRCSFSIDFEEF